MRIALATALALILATPSLANDNAALFLAEHAAETAEKTAETAAAPDAPAAVAAPAATGPQAFFLAEAAHAEVAAPDAGPDEAQANAAAPAPALDASHPAKAFFLADAAARAGDEPAAGSVAARPAAAVTAAPAAPAGSVQALVTAAALRHGIDPTLAHAMAMVESNYRCSAVGRAGELGVMQVKPATARSVGVTGNLRDCATGIEAGMRYLRASIDRHGSGCGGISAYNMGIHRKASFCNGYGRKVMARMSRVQVASLD